MNAITKHKAKIHIWGIVSISIVALVYWNLEFFILPWWVPIIILSWFTKSKAQFKKEFQTPLSKKTNYFILGFIMLFVGLIFYHASSGFHNSESMSSESQRFLLFIYVTFIGIAYGIMIKTIKKS